MIRKVMMLILVIMLVNLSKSQQPIINTSTDIYLQLKKLKVLGSVLYIAAHPDDENNTLLPYLTKEKMYRTAYLSLTRGDGGQNLIGSEQGVDLGLIRTQELLAARKIDGAEQYFSRAYEFGFSKTSSETLHIWDSVKVLSDVVWMIRKFQPDVIITRFPPDARAGHGHHAASAILANEAFFAAADSTKFPEQFKYGVKPYQAKRIVWNTYNFGGNNTTNDSQLKIDIGGYSSLLGKSYGEIGAEARTMHKSQGEGRPRRRGQLIEYFSHTAGDTAKIDLLDGIDISWKKFPNGSKIEGVIDLIISRYNFEKPEASIPSLVQLYRGIQAMQPSNWRDKKLLEVQNIIEACSGLFIESTTSQEYVVQGDSLKAIFFINNRKGVNASLKKIDMEGMDSVFSKTLSPNENISFSESFYVPQDKPLTQPYWLQEPQEKGMFVVKNQILIGNADSKPAYELNFTVNIEGQNFIIPKSIQYKYVDPVKGELYQPLQVFPIATVEVDDEEKMVRENSATAKITITANKNNIEVRPRIGLNIDGGYNYKYEDIDKVATLNEYKKSVDFTHQIKYAKQSYEVSGLTDKERNNVIQFSLHQIKYDHIPTITYFTKAKINTHKLDAKIIGNKIGYIVGAGDKVPEALQQLGYEVDILTEKDFTENNIKQYQAIITGIRSYNLLEWLTTKNNVMNDYINNGGNLIVQYLRSPLVNGKKIQVGPYNFSVNAQSRVTEEDAVVNFSLSNHPVLNYPNKITAQDFDGWIQERSTYQAENLDANFETPLTMNDKNDKPSNGSLAIAKYGKGNIAYVSLAMFRQIPAGVAGAYRLMANLIALPQKKN